MVNTYHIQIFLGSLFVSIGIFLACSGQTSQSQITPETLINPSTIDNIDEPQISKAEIVPTVFPTPTTPANKEPTTSLSSNNADIVSTTALITQVNNEANIPLGGKKGGSLKLASKDYFGSLDPHQNYSASYSTWGIGVIYQRLLKFSSGPNIVLPSKATECDTCQSWEMLDGKTFIFNIDPDVTWQSIDSKDLGNMSVEDIKFSLERQMNINNKNADRFHMIHSVESKPDKGQLQINLHAPDADIFISLADGRSKLISKSHSENSNYTDSGSLVGSGPWKLSKLSENSYSILENSYSIPNPPYLDAIEFHILPDQQTRLSAYSVGLIDVYNIDQHSSKMDISFADPAPGQGFEIAFTTANYPFNDFDIRSAARNNINPDEIIKEAWNNQAFFSLGFAASHSSWIPERSVWEPYFSPYKQSEPFEQMVPIDIITSDFGAKFKKSVEITSQHLSLAGFQPTIHYVNRRQYTELQWKGGDFQVLMGPTFPHSSTNAFVIPILHSKGKWNTTNHQNLQLDEMIEKQSQEYIFEKRSKIINKINSQLLEKSYRFMPATQKNLWAWTEDLKNIHPNFSGFEYTHWEKVWLDR